MGDCSICCEPFNKSNRCKINCKTCNTDNITVCQSCAKRYILEQPTDPSCMVCKVEWDTEFLSNNFTKVFVNKELKNHRENYLLEKQIAMLPETQEYAEQLKLIDGLEKQKEIVLIKKKKLEKELRKLNSDIREIEVTVSEIRHGTYNKDKPKSHFCYKCPVDNCNGFLNERFECGICDNKICRHCMEIKGEDHECDEDKKETVKLLRQDTKPCPKCGELIHKLPNGCFAKDTKILMWDGSIKLSQDIKIGDELIGDDGNIRIVTKLMDGIDDMYEIQQNKGMNYIVNSKHILTLYFPHNGKIVETDCNTFKLTWFNKDDYSINTKRFKTKIEAEEFKSFKQINEKLIDIPVKNYLELSNSNKNDLKGIKLEKSINWKYQHIELDPYILGLWLGDGYSNGKEFCTNDKEILDIWYNWCEDNNALIVKRKDNFRYCIKNKDNQQDSGKHYPYKNPLKSKLLKYKLVNNKHIPSIYLINSRDVRLKLLAGIIDTDGCVQNNGRRIVIITIYETLSKNIEFLANSLGYSVNITIRKKENIKCPNSDIKNYKNQYNINISGKNINEIPTILNRKKCKEQEGGVNLRTTNINVIKIEKDKYYGWNITDNKRFLLQDFTISHNCDQMYCIKCHTAFSWRTGQLERGHIHNPEYYRWMRENGKDIPRNPLDVRHDPCGNQIIDYTSLLMVVRNYFPRIVQVPQANRRNNNPIIHDSQQTIIIVNMHRMIGHINYINISYQNENRYKEDHLRNMRAGYILNKLSKDEFKKKLQMLEKKNNKSRRMNDVWNLLRLVLIEYIGKITEQQYEKEEGIRIINEIVKESEKIRKYCNNLFNYIGKVFNVVYPGVNTEWIQINNWEAYIKEHSRTQPQTE